MFESPYYPVNTPGVNSQVRQSAKDKLTDEEFYAQYYANNKKIRKDYNLWLTNLSLLRRSQDRRFPRLIENLVFPNLIHKDFSNDFQPGKGTQIQVRKPVVLKATDFDASTGTSPQSIVDTSVTVTLDHIASVDVEASAVDMAMSIDDLTRVFIEPAAVALAEKINRDGLDLYKDIPYCVGTPGATADSLEKLADVSKGLNDRKVPTENRVALWDTAADAKLKTIPAIVNAEKERHHRSSEKRCDRRCVWPA